MAKGKPLSDFEIKAILSEHINNSYGYFDTELTDSRRKATEYYLVKHLVMNKKEDHKLFQLM